jgi:RHS repeat-associated protein
MTENDVSPRWVGSGWTVFNNKGKPVRQYEPFFTDTHRCEFDVRIGVSPILFYDPLERVIATLHPNHTYEKVVFDPWRQETWDVSDTVLVSDPKTDPDVGNFFRRLPDAEYIPTWYALRQDGELGPQEQDAAHKAAAHANTPAVAYLDSLGRTFLTIADNGPDGRYPTRVQLDIEGNTRAVIDARGNTVMEYAYSMVGPEEEEGEDEEGEEEEGEEEEGEDEGEEEQPDSHLIYQKSMDAGERWILYNVAGNLIRSWDSRDHTIRTTYDAIQRPTHLFVRQGGSNELLAEYTIYGEGHIDPESVNLRGEIYRQHDGAGMVTNEAFDFKGNLLQSSRQLAVEYKTMVDWSQSPALEQESFTTTTSYDALDRPVSLVTPDASEIRHIYNEANLLEKVDVRLRDAVDWTPFVLDMEYNAKGQREKVEYGSGVITEYDYDPDIFRLTRLITTRNTDNKRLQNLSYTYDPVGNITEIGDAAQQSVFFNNQVVNPSGKYEYDALYRLVKAEGREHADQNGNNQPNHRDIPRMPLPHANDTQALRRYTEQYEYDTVGNILKMIHQAVNGNWTRRYQYAANNNRLLATSLPGDPEGRPYTATYNYDEHGNMTSMPHLPEMKWNHEDQMHEVDLGGGGTAYYVYDAEGQRVRKVHEHNGSTAEERIYVGDFEIYRKRNGSGLTLERETLHIMDDEKRIALVETKTHDQNTPVVSPVPVIRYQIGNHLGSSSLELDNNGSVISYEEYHPYGTTAYHSAHSGVELSLKRYRYTGKERDEETGLNYRGARYYVPWLGRWICPDPDGAIDGINLYSYVSNNPINFIDPKGDRQIRPDHLRTYLPWTRGYRLLTGGQKSAYARSGARSPGIRWKSMRFLLANPGSKALRWYNLVQFHRLSRNLNRMIQKFNVAMKSSNWAEAKTLFSNFIKKNRMSVVNIRSSWGGRKIWKALPGLTKYKSLYPSKGMLVFRHLRVGGGTLLLAFSLAASYFKVTSTAPGKRGKAIAKEAGGFFGGLLGSSGGLVLSGVTLTLLMSTPPGWLLIGVGGLGAVAGGYVGNRFGRRIVGKMYEYGRAKINQAAERVAVPLSRFKRSVISHAFGPPL